MRKILHKICLIVCAVMLFGLSACTAKLPTKGTVAQDGISIFPKSEKGYVGDPMPYFDGEKMNVFYLYDARRAGPFHPWYLFQTDDFCRWDDKGVAINWENDVTSPDYALGTGSVIKDEAGLYHAYYTGWNNGIHTPYTEKIQHATSPDLLNWTKIPEDGFYGNQNDFRDPYVYFSEQDDCYYMLITSSQGGGVLRQYKSNDLKNWSDNGIFFRHDSANYNMECPTFLHFNGYWYLSWSDQAPDGGTERMFRYRYKKNLTDAWIKPEVDYVDGAGFYAGRMEKFHDRLMAFGWVPTKQYDYDMGVFDWGGNLVTHELKQRQNGELYAAPTNESDSAISTQVAYNKAGGNAEYKNGTVKFGDTQQHVLFESLEKKPTKITFTLKPERLEGCVKLLFGAEGGEVNKALSINIDFDNMRLEFYRPNPNGGETLQIYAEFSEKDFYDCVVFTENDCLTLYLGDERAITTRIYGMPNTEFGFSADNGAKIEGLKFYE